MVNASELMVDSVSVAPDEPVLNTIELILGKNISSVIIIDNGILKGVATLRDFIMRVPWGEKNLNEIKIRDIMTKDVLVVHPEDKIKKVFNLISSREIRVVPVVSENVVKGVIGRKEIAELFAEKLGHRYTVRDLMTYRYTSYSIHATLDEVMDKIIHYNEKSIVVLKGKEVIGIVTLSDILRHIYRLKKIDGMCPVRDIMTPNPITAQEDDKCDKIARIMIEKRISSLPVVKGQLEGLISIKCLFKVMEF